MKRGKYLQLPQVNPEALTRCIIKNFKDVGFISVDFLQVDARCYFGDEISEKRVSTLSCQKTKK